MGKHVCGRKTFDILRIKSKFEVKLNPSAFLIVKNTPRLCNLVSMPSAQALKHPQKDINILKIFALKDFIQILSFIGFDTKSFELSSFLGSYFF